MEFKYIPETNFRDNGVVKSLPDYYSVSFFYNNTRGQENVVWEIWINECGNYHSAITGKLSLVYLYEYLKILNIVKEFIEKNNLTYGY